MDTFTATMICEGMEEADEDTRIEAWQHLIDTGVAWQLQGSFGRTAQNLIDQGICTRPEPKAVPGTVGPFVKVSQDEIVKFETDDGERSFRVLLYGGYNARGLIGHECNGVAVLDEDQLQVLCDEIGCEASGYYGPSDAQLKLYESIKAMSWTEFRSMINSHKRARYQI